MTDKTPSSEDWKTLYELMTKLRNISPWQWLEEQDIFGVQNPDTDEIGFVSIMGSIEEHYSISVYQGEDALQKFWNFQETAIDDFAFQRLLEMPHIQASFEDREYLYKEDREIIKKLSFTFRGKHSWPMFRSYVPGFAPWFITALEARFLICALEQTIDVAIRAKDKPSILNSPDQGLYLLRKTVKKENTVQWQDSVWKESTTNPEVFDISLDMITIEKIKSLPSYEMSLEIDVFMAPNAIYEPNLPRPYYPYAILLIETTKGMIVENELIQPLPTLNAMWEKVPYHIMNIFIRSGMKPSQILTRCKVLFQLLSPICSDLNISVEHVENLPFSKEAGTTFLDFLKEQN